MILREPFPFSRAYLTVPVGRRLLTERTIVRGLISYERRIEVISLRTLPSGTIACHDLPDGESPEFSHQVRRREFQRSEQVHLSGRARRKPELVRNVIFPFTWPKSAELEKLPDYFFTDAYLLATAEADGIPEIASFDRGLRNVPGVRRIGP